MEYRTMGKKEIHSKNVAVCPECGQAGSPRKAKLYHHETGKRIRMLSLRAAITSGLILSALSASVMVVVLEAENVETIFFPVLVGSLCLCIVLISLGIGWAYGALTKRKAAANAMRFYHFRCSQCKHKWDQWQGWGWAETCCPMCDSPHVTARNQFVDASGNPVTLDTLAWGLVGIVVFSFVIVLAVFLLVTPLPSQATRKPPIFFFGLGAVGIWGSSIKILRFMGRREVLTFLCFECKHEWSDEGHTPTAEESDEHQSS